ncbi:UNVERIFIED_ORG: Ti type entry exclusion protein TrbK [Rhizobium etli]|uniref:Probable conjugal transfer protein TrbK n=1 Tax=Rhizobium etli TaxID=29449 RepID=Q84HS6_RHIET|nr:MULTISPECIES: entry exclusion protein TrbK [Rhizobium]AAO43552.1 probable conjugal transfer protein TrbK [Rhizobium etli CFN 42]ULR42482.1 entry exclusion protein TrbK [Rhizobium sp. K102]
MSRAVVIAVLALVAAFSSAATVLIVNSKESNKPALAEEQRTVREKFFGSNMEPPPIKDGQEMRPRW